MKKVVLIVISVIVVILVIVFGVITFIFKDSEKFVCKSSEGSITIYYKNGKINGYSSVGRYSYDFDEQKKDAEQMGIEEYFEQFNVWFVENSTNGKCEKK